MIRLAATLALLPFCAAPVSAEVVKAEAAGMVIERTVTVDAAPDVVWDTLRAPQRWWPKDHTWSGDPANLYLDSQATGCFCEKLPGKGSVEHAHIVYVDKSRLLRMRGALGPMQAEAVDGVMTITLAPEGDKATKVTMRYVAGGYFPDGFEKLAPMADEVMGLQIDGLKAAAENPPAPAQ